MVKHRFKKIETAEDVLEAIGKTDIPSTKVAIRRPAVDEETGEYLADFELEIPDEYPLSSTDEKKLEELMKDMGLKRRS